MPIAVAKICTEEIGLGVRSTICALLHDTVEDTDVTLDDIEKAFGSEIARIVDGLTKISNVIDVNASQQAENFKKILLTLTDDPRVILIKLADRLHNMRTLDHMKSDKQLKISSETVYVYAPIAVLGIVLSWAIFGTIPITIEGKGLAMNQKGLLFNVQSRASGIVKDVFVKPGNFVTSGQIIAEIFKSPNF